MSPPLPLLAALRLLVSFLPRSATFRQSPLDPPTLTVDTEVVVPLVTVTATFFPEEPQPARKIAAPASGSAAILALTSSPFARLPRR
jgi:hypothetical protein